MHVCSDQTCRYESYSKETQRSVLPVRSGTCWGVNQWINTIEEEDDSQVPIRNQQACKAEVYSKRSFQQLYLWQTELLVQKWKPCFFDGLEERIIFFSPPWCTSLLQHNKPEIIGYVMCLAKILLAYFRGFMLLLLLFSLLLSLKPSH